MRPAGEYTSEEDRNDRPIPTVSDTPVGWVILAERGPMDTQVECRGWDAVLATFGGFTTWNLDSMGPLKQFFDEGGQVAHVVRTCHHTDPADPATKTSAKATCTLQTAALVATAGSVLSANAAPYNLEPGDTLVIDRDALGQATATFTATAGSSTGAATAPYALANGQTLTVSIDGGAVQTVAFLTAEFVDIANATAAEVVAVLNAKLVGAQADINGGAPRIRSDKRGTGSGVNVTGGTANAELGFTPGNVAGTGNVADIEAVSAAEVKTIVEAAVSGVTVTNEGGYQRISSNTTGASSMVQVTAGSTADDELGFDNAQHTGNAGGAANTLQIDAKDDGAYANAIRILPAAPSSGEAGRFNLKVERAGVVVRTHENLSMDPADPRYVETIVNDENTGDALIRATDLAAAVSDTLAIPATTPVTMAGGGDGLVALDDNDFIGGATGAGRVGFRCLDKVAILGLLAPQRATPAVELAKLTYIETYQKGRCFTVCEPPAGYSKAQIITYWKTTAGLYRLSRKVSGQWPRVKVANPNRAVYGNVDLVTIPTGGLMFGVYARGDAVVGGAFEHPAGTDTTVLPPSGFLPRTVLGLETDEVLEPSVAGELQAALINPIRRENGPYFIDGSLTANDQSAWSSVGQSRGIIWAMKQCAENLTFMRHRRINEELLDAGAQQLDTFWEAITAAGKLSSRKKSEAYFIDAGKGLNTRATKKAKQTFIRIGVATDEPNMFTNLIFSPYDGADVAELQAS